MRQRAPDCAAGGRFVDVSHLLGERSCVPDASASSCAKSNSLRAPASGFRGVRGIACASRREYGIVDPKRSFSHAASRAGCRGSTALQRSTALYSLYSPLTATAVYSLYNRIYTIQHSTPRLCRVRSGHAACGSSRSTEQSLPVVPSPLAALAVHARGVARSGVRSPGALQRLYTPHAQCTPKKSHVLAPCSWPTPHVVSSSAVPHSSSASTGSHALPDGCCVQ